MIIRGLNLGEKQTEYRGLSQWPYFKDIEQKRMIVKKLEKMYMDSVEESKETEVQLFPQKNGKVEIVPGMLNHRCSNSLDSLKAISQYGILASEWFGIVESEREAVFCSFVDRIHSEENPNNRAQILNAKRLRSLGNELLLFLDNNHPVMKKLLHLDFFEYKKVKKLTPEKLTEMYTEEEIELFDQIIEPFSGDLNYHIDEMLPYHDWSAIPGGIPAALVNGICTKRVTYDKEYIDELIKLFPSATIFNGDLEIIYTPEKVKNTQELGKEVATELPDSELLDGIELEEARQENEIASKREKQGNVQDK